MFRVTTLLENRKDKYLDVCIQEEGFEEKEDAKFTISNTEKQVVRGSICFYDERDPKTITSDFAFTYKSLERLGKSRDGSYCFVRYQEHITTTPLAFVEYFSKRHRDLN